MEASEASPVSEEEEVCPANNNHHNRKNKSTQQSTTNFSVSTKRPPPNKSEKLSEEKPSKNTQIKAVIPINSRKSPTLIKLSPTLKRDNCMMSMARRVSRTVDPQEAAEWAISSAASSEVEDKEILDQKKPNLNLLKSKLHSMTFTLAQ